jgi:hypothetical protein
MEITDFIQFFIAGGLLGISGQVIRVFVGLTKSNARNEQISIQRLVGSITVGFVSGGVAIFTLCGWNAGFRLNEDHSILLISIGYAGTDFLEGLFRSMISKSVGTIDRETPSEEIPSNQALQNMGFPNAHITKSSLINTILDDDPTIEYSPAVNKNVISEHAIYVIKNMLRDSSNTSARITSSARTPYEQALAMYNNILSRGVEDQKALYGSYGDKVIDVYIEQKAAGKSKGEILESMEAKILELGPRNVSRHCADFNKLVVVDIAPSSISNKSGFTATAYNYETSGVLSKFLQPEDGDPAYHLEIPNQITSMI